MKVKINYKKKLRKLTETGMLKIMTNESKAMAESKLENTLNIPP